MELPTSFSDFLSKIRLNDDQKTELQTAHTDLRQRLIGFDGTKDLVSSTFIQGSYRRATIVQPPDHKKLDVDVVAVTTLDRNVVPPESAIKKFIPFLEHYYKGCYRPQGRSIGIELDEVELDLVITVPQDEATRSYLRSESLQNYDSVEDGLMFLAENRTSVKSIGPLYLPDRDVKRWTRTHPIAQMEYTWAKNAACNKHFVNVVKALKWWKRKAVSDESSIKSYPLERLIGECCPDGINSVAEGVVKTFENVLQRFQGYRQSGTVPHLADHGVPEHNVFKRVTGEDFAAFFDIVKESLVLARAAYDSEDANESRRYWHSLFGDPFPRPTSPQPRGGFSERQEITSVGKSDRFA